MTIPKFVSDDCTDFIKRILNTNPDERFSIEDIRKHKWYNIVDSTCNKNTEGIIVGINSIPIEKDIV